MASAPAPLTMTGGPEPAGADDPSSPDGKMALEALKLTGRGGYPKDCFTTDVDDSLLCTICLDVAAGAVSCNHGHTFCFECIMKWLENNATCPVDRAKLTVRRIIPGLALRNIINQLKLTCDQDNCKWEGTVAEFEDHQEKEHNLAKRAKPEVPKVSRRKSSIPGAGGAPGGGSQQLMRRQLQYAIQMRSNWARQVGLEDDALFSNPTLFHVFEYLKLAFEDGEYGPMPVAWAPLMSEPNFYQMISEIRQDLDAPLKMLHSKIPVLMLAGCLVTCCIGCPCYCVHALMWRKRIEKTLTAALEKVEVTIERHSNLPEIRDKGLYIGVHVMPGRFEFAMGNIGRVLFLAIHPNNGQERRHSIAP